MPKQTFYVKGMHCASCELLIERKLKEIIGVSDVNVSLKTKALEISCDENQQFSARKLNRLFNDTEYSFATEKPIENETSSLTFTIVTAAVLLGVIFFASKIGLLNSVRITSESSLPLIFTFGLIAGFSSCAALIGGLVISLSEKWNEAYTRYDSFSSKITPHLLFNSGRLISFALLGAVLGVIGSKFKLSGPFTVGLIVFVSVIMILLALQMLGVRALDGFKIALPKKLTSHAADDKKFSGAYAPFFTGFITFLLPCGFTLIAEGVAILAGSALRSSLIMLSFVLGTTIPLLLIGVFSVKLVNSKAASEKFLKVAGLVVIFFALYNINVQLGITARAFSGNNTTRSSVYTNAYESQSQSTAQVIKTIYTSANDISPSTFTVSVGKPVRFEVYSEDNGYGCMSTIMVRGLYNQPQLLRQGQTIVMEFTPTETGSYQITCAMGVPRGVINVE